jgi:hypothetical protein
VVKLTPPCDVQVNLKREKLDVNPVFSTAMLDDDGHKLGYIRLVNFSQKAPQEVERSMKRLEVGPHWALPIAVFASHEIISSPLSPPSLLLHPACVYAGACAVPSVLPEVKMCMGHR